MSDTGADVEREKETMGIMIGIYCRGNHGGRDDLCPECKELRDYAFGRIDRCPIRDHKVRCSRCEIHCYSPVMRERIRAVMRYSGPRMMLHPVLAIRHLMS